MSIKLPQINIINCNRELWILATQRFIQIHIYYLTFFIICLRQIISQRIKSCFVTNNLSVSFIGKRFVFYEYLRLIFITRSMYRELKFNN